MSNRNRRFKILHINDSVAAEIIADYLVFSCHRGDPYYKVEIGIKNLEFTPTFNEHVELHEFVQAERNYNDRLHLIIVKCNLTTYPDNRSYRRFEFKECMHIDIIPSLENAIITFRGILLTTDTSIHNLRFQPTIKNSDLL